MGIDCGSQVVICDVPIRFDTYKGCSHDCKYCFARKDRDISKIEVDRSISQLKNFIEGKRTQVTNWCDWDIPIHWGGMSDPFQPCEKHHRASYEALKLFAQTQYPFIVSTKGRLIASDEYVELIKKCNAVVQISLVCPEYDKLEKGAPTYSERVEIIRKLAPNCKRLIVRIQPYMVEVFDSVMRSLHDFKQAGAYGVTIEGMKFARKKPGLIRLGGDWVYPEELLRRHYQKIKEKCHELGLGFFCAENRLRSMGDSMTCCGCAGLDGFKPNTFNVEHLYNKNVEFVSETMKTVGTAHVFKGCFQEAGSFDFLKTQSFAQMMTSNRVLSSYLPVVGAKTQTKGKNTNDD